MPSGPLSNASNSDSTVVSEPDAMPLTASARSANIAGRRRASCAASDWISRCTLRVSALDAWQKWQAATARDRPLHNLAAMHDLPMPAPARMTKARLPSVPAGFANQASKSAMSQSRVPGVNASMQRVISGAKSIGLSVSSSQASTSCSAALSSAGSSSWTISSSRARRQSAMQSSAGWVGAGGRPVHRS